ncbi:hypothetical protein [Niallia sp. FSL M8-0099]
MKYAITLDGYLVAKYDTPVEAYNAAKFAYEETGLFHEVKLYFC